MTTTNRARYLVQLAAELESRIESNDLRGFTAEQLSRAAEYYRGMAAMGGAL